jgi:hypothetical protein
LLINEGNFKHNVEVLKSQSGLIVVARREKIQLDDGILNDIPNPLNYVPCEYCYKFFSKFNLWHHVKQCCVRKFHNKADCNDNDENSDNSDASNNNLRHAKSLLYSAVMEDTTENSNLILQLLNRMNDGPEKSMVLTDDILKPYVLLRVESLGSKDDQKLNDIHRVSQGVRTLARLVLEARKTQPTCTIDMLLKHDRFDTVVQCTTNLCLEGDSECFTLGSKMGNLLGHATSIKSGLAIRANDEDKLQETNKFKMLFDVEWNKRVNSILKQKKAKSDLAKMADIYNLYILLVYLISSFMKRTYV